MVLKQVIFFDIISFFMLICFSFPQFSYASPLCQENTRFNIGAARYDITGPAAEEGMMGYGLINQQTAGIYQRLWARAFVIESPCNGKRVAIVNTDLCMVFEGVKQKVIAKLKNFFGNLYTNENVLLTAIHNHSGPGGFSTDAFYNLTTFGFYHKHFDVIVDGIVASIVRAHHNLMPATIKITAGDLPGIGFNRSPNAYLQNPQIERDAYTNNVDTTMTLLRFDGYEKEVANEAIGMMNWFPLHGVSMNNKNHLIIGDNKGYAAHIFEKEMNNTKASGTHRNHAFIAGFLQANAGDVSPNPLGHEGGSGLAGLLAIKKAGLPQYQMAKELFAAANEVIKGEVDYRHIFIAMDQILITPEYSHGEFQQTCPAAIGISMLAGTQDGEGIGKQGVTCNVLTHLLPKFVCKVVTTQCQGVKPIIIPTEHIKPYPWTPNILPLQVIKIGQIVIASVPFEITTMAGRRIIKSIQQELAKAHDSFDANQHDYVVLSTLSNAYAGYVTTPEEYQLQRYEGASDHFGPWTASALEQELTRLTHALIHGEEVPTSAEPPDLSTSRIHLQPNVILDLTPRHVHFGDRIADAKPMYKRGETVTVSFWGAHPKNNFHIETTFLTIDYLDHGQWKIIRTDNDWDTEYHWKRHRIASSIVTIVWRMPKSTLPGMYRIVHYGDRKLLNGQTKPYTGYSSPFVVQ